MDKVVNLAWLEWECEDCHKTNLTFTRPGGTVYCSHCGQSDIVPPDVGPKMIGHVYKRAHEGVLDGQYKEVGL